MPARGRPPPGEQHGVWNVDAGARLVLPDRCRVNCLRTVDEDAGVTGLAAVLTQSTDQCDTRPCEGNGRRQRCCGDRAGVACGIDPSRGRCGGSGRIYPGCGDGKRIATVGLPFAAGSRLQRGRGG